MQLQIYQISHPLIKLISNRINTRYISHIDKKQCEKYVGFLIIYEIFRKYISIGSIYIKLTEGTKTIDIINNNKRQILLTNISNTYNMLTDITSIASNLELHHVEYENKNEIKNYIENIYSDNKDIDVFIIEKITKNYKVINLLEYLIKEKNISLDNISICNIFSYSGILKEIGQKYPKLKVYTTKVQ